MQHYRHISCLYGVRNRSELTDFPVHISLFIFFANLALLDVWQGFGVSDQRPEFQCSSKVAQNETFRLFRLILSRIYSTCLLWCKRLKCLPLFSRFLSSWFCLIHQLNHLCASWHCSDLAHFGPRAHYDGDGAVPPCNWARRRYISGLWPANASRSLLSTDFPSVRHWQSLQSLQLWVFCCRLHFRFQPSLFCVSLFCRNWLVVHWWCVPLVSIQFFQQACTRVGWSIGSVIKSQCQWDTWRRWSVCCSGHYPGDILCWPLQPAWRRQLHTCPCIPDWILELLTLLLIHRHPLMFATLT